MTQETLVEVKNLKKYFPVNRGVLGHHVEGTVKAVDDVSFEICKGETLGFIGESGCGKSTLARLLLGLARATEGSVRFRGREIGPGKMGEDRKRIQMVFQDPYSSIDPRMNIRRTIEEPLRVHTRMSRAEKRAAVMTLIESMGLSEEDLAKYPHEFSGGQRQRIGIARAFVLNPDFVICDEPVSALDVSIQAQILNLFKRLQRERGVTYLFISHDMSVIKHVSDRIAVMYLGQIMELAGKDELFRRTLHPYSVALMGAIPVPNPEYRRARVLLKGDLPSPLNPPSGCRFSTRCEHVMDLCRARPAPLAEVSPGHFVACHLYGGQTHA